jgi:hypothetical protein
MQADERAHQALLRREQAHTDARSTYLPMAEEIPLWIEYWWTSDFGHDYDVYPQQMVKPSKVTGPLEAITMLRRISSGHPTDSVRLAARRLSDRIQTVYNEPRPLGDGTYANEPDDDDYRKWNELANELIDKLHDPMILIAKDTSA